MLLRDCLTLSGIHYTNGFIKPFPLLQKRYLLFQNPPVLSAMNGWPFGVAGTITVNQEVTFDLGFRLLHILPFSTSYVIYLYINHIFHCLCSGN